MDTNNTLLSFNKLLEEFRNIHPNSTRLPTYLEIAGKAQKEDVISNILAFFFDPNEPHKLGKLFYTTFLQCLGIIDKSIKEEIAFVSREVTTAKGKRIDLLIETNYSILVIENKVFHHLNNDLNEYAAHAKRINKKKHCYLGVLSLYPIECGVGFINITHNQFIKALKDNLCNLQVTIEPIYAPLLNDFFETLSNLKIQNMLDEKIRQFLITNEELIDNLIVEKGRFDDDIKNKTNELIDLIVEKPKVLKDKYKNFSVVNRKTFRNNLVLMVCCEINYQGFRIRVFVDKHGNDNSTAKMLEAIPYFEGSANMDEYIGEVMPYDTPLQEVADKVNEVLHKVFP